MIKLGNNDIALKVGSADVSAAYLGSTLVYTSAPPEPKWIATYTGGTTSSAECDASSTITENEITKANLQRVEIGQCVTTIGNYAFVNYGSLISITIPDSVTSIGQNAFYYCTVLTSVAIPDSVTSIGNRAFNSCTGLTSVTIGSGVTSIGEMVFQHCRSLTSITIPDNVTTIGNNAFSQCTGLTSVTIGSGVTSIGQQTFQGCYSLSSLIIPNSVTSIAELAFNSCFSLTSATIGNGVATIGNDAFSFCTGLTSVTIGSGVTSIGERAFIRCSGLTGVTVLATTPPTLGTSAFNDTNDCAIYVPSQSVSTYKSASGWSDYASRIQAIPTPSPQWVTFNSGDDISGLNIYGIKGNALDLSNNGAINLTGGIGNFNTIEFDFSRNVVNVSISDCYTDSVAPTDDVEYIFIDIGCYDYFTIDTGQTAGTTFQLYIYQ